MNFTPNPANAPLAGRVQQQQVHQVPVTTSAGAPQGGNMNKNINMPTNPSFLINQQAANMAQKISDDNKNQMPPSTVGHHQVQQPAQNNNNHGMGAIPQQLLNIQHQQSMSRNVNLSHQSTFQQSPHLMQKSVFQQMQQMTYQSQSFPQNPVSVPQNQQLPIHMQAGQPGNILQKLQATIPHAMTQTKPPPMQQLHQMKPAQSHPPPPPVSQHNMQYSPSKLNHPQMKTTAKLASPGSQLQTLQKSPTAPAPPAHPQIPQQAASQNKNVPSTPPISSPIGSGGVPVSFPVPAENTSPAKAPTPAATTAKPAVSNSATPAVPSLTITATTSTPSPTKPATPAVIEQASTKAVEQPKEVIPPQAKTVPKPVAEEKKAALVVSVAETNNKLEKSPAAVAPKTAAVTSPSSIKSTMRLATVTPRQKKPPPTNNVSKKPSPPAAPLAAAPTAQSVQKSPAKAAPAPAKTVEAPKPTPATPKKAPAPAAVTPKTNLGPSTSSAQSTSSSASATSGKTKRSRVKVQPYQSPTPEIALVTKLSTKTANPTNKNGTNDKLTYFFK